MSNVALITRWFEEVWNQGSEDAIDAMLADPCRICDLDEGDICCPEEFKAFHRKLNVALAGITVVIDHVIESGDEVAGIATVRATHRATGKPVCFKTSFFSLVRDGKAVEAFNVTDFLSLFIQAGILPADTVQKGMQGEEIG